MDLLAILALGFFLGVRHATDSDHVVAVTAIVSRERNARAAIGIGALWGIGHTATILVVGGAIVLFGLVIPPRLGLSMEMSVAVMLIVLGSLNLSGSLRRIREAGHGSSAPAAAPHVHGAQDCQASLSRKLPRSLRPLLIGVVHGLAGSAAVALLVLATLRSAGLALVYLAVFGFGTVVGMMLLTLLMAVPIVTLSSRLRSFDHLLARATGLLSIAFGLFLAYRIGVVDGLLFGEVHWDPH